MRHLTSRSVGSGQVKHTAAMTRRLLTLLLVVAACDLATAAGVGASIAAKEPPAASSPRLLHDNGSPASGVMLLHVTDHAPARPQPQPPASPTHRQEHTHTRSRSSQGGEAGGGEDSSGVDTVLAALVDYSKNPKLWRFVHSVVDELDYSLRASHPQASATPRHPRPAVHLSRPRTTNHWGRTSVGGKQDTGQSNSHTDTWNGPEEGATTTTTATPLMPWLQQPPEQPFPGGRPTQDRNNVSSAVPAARPSNRVNFVKSLPSPSTHFFFHRVFLDKTFDNHTRQPYRRPVLALTARDISAAKSSTDEKGRLPEATNHSAPRTDPGAAAKEFTDKFDSLSPSPATRSGEASQGKEVMQDGDRKPGGDGDSEDDLPETQHYHHHHRHRLHTFKSQLQFLQRWEERLWRRAHLQERQLSPGSL